MSRARCSARGRAAREVLAALARRRVVTRALVLENDYRDGDPRRLAADIDWTRARLRELAPLPIEVAS
ncbi:hypothetical protein NKH77_38840 [Streptomyces sp. M19]